MLKIHFLNVGHGDCTIIEHESGNITMIDICNGEELDLETAGEITEELGFPPQALINSMDKEFETPYEILFKAGYKRTLTNPIEYFVKTIGKSSTFRYIQSHPDLDHMRGLTALRKVGINIINFWDTDHTKTVEEFHFPSDEEEWNEYQKHRSGKEVTLLKLKRGSIGQYYNKHPELPTEGDGLYILSPTQELIEQANNTENWNNHSYVLYLGYKNIKVIFGGDAETVVWDSIVNKYGANLACHVYKASHHGRDSGFNLDAFKHMNPKYTIVSVGKKPETDASNKYKSAGCLNVWSTRWKGDIICNIDDEGNYSFTSQTDD